MTALQAPREQQHHAISASDLSMLSLLTGDSPPSTGIHNHESMQDKNNKRKKQSDRRPPVDPLMVAAAASAGPE